MAQETKYENLKITQPGACQKLSGRVPNVTETYITVPSHFIHQFVCSFIHYQICFRLDLEHDRYANNSGRDPV